MTGVNSTTKAPEKIEPKQHEVKPVQPVETKKEEPVAVKEEPKPEPIKEEPVPKLPLATSPGSASPTDGLSRENSMAGLTKEQKLAIIRERKARLLTPRSAAEAEKAESTSSSTSTTETAAKTESESADDIASAVITEIRVTFKALNKHGKPKST